MAATTQEKVTHTPGPWKIESHDRHASGPRWVVCAPDHDNRVCVLSVDGAPNGNYQIAEANAKLIAAAPDHATLAAAMIAGLVRWEPFDGAKDRGEVCCNSLRYATQLDEFGVPELNDSIRAAIAKAQLQ